MRNKQENTAMELQPVKQRIKWIDCAKTVAIIGVLIDHNNRLLYTNQTIAKASYFAVCLFVILAGITAFDTTKVVRGGAGINTGKVWAKYYCHMQWRPLFYRYRIIDFLICKRMLAICYIFPYRDHTIFCCFLFS